MRSALLSFVFALGASAAAFPPAPHPHPPSVFSLHSEGKICCPVGVLGDGQLRLGGNHPKAIFHFEGGKGGPLKEGKNFGCLVTDAGQVQCDRGAKGDTRFSVEKGHFLYKGNDQFFACPASEFEFNIYTRPVPGQKKCVDIKLNVENPHDGEDHNKCFLPHPIPQPPKKPMSEKHHHKSKHISSSPHKVTSKVKTTSKKHTPTKSSSSVKTTSKKHTPTTTRKHHSTKPSSSIKTTTRKRTTSSAKTTSRKHTTSSAKTTSRRHTTSSAKTRKHTSTKSSSSARSTSSRRRH